MPGSKGHQKREKAPKMVKSMRSGKFDIVLSYCARLFGAQPDDGGAPAAFILGCELEAFYLRVAPE